MTLEEQNAALRQALEQIARLAHEGEVSAKMQHALGDIAKAALRPAFSRSMLPVLGVMWHQFASLPEAEAFAEWAEAETANDEHPCDAFISAVDHSAAFEVKVRNW